MSLRAVFNIFLIKNNLTQRKWCIINNIDITSLNNWLTGKTLPRVDIAFKIEQLTHGTICAKDFIPNMCEDNGNCNNKIKKVKNNKNTVSTKCEDNGDTVCDNASL